MTDTTQDVRGPIDFLLIEFDAARSSGGGAQALLDLVESGTIVLYDVRLVRKDDDGTVHHLDLSTAGVELGDLPGLAWGTSGLLDGADLEHAASLVEPGTLALLLVYENAWAIPFVTAARRAGGQVVASARLSAQDVNRALDEQDTLLDTTKGD